MVMDHCGGGQFEPTYLGYLGYLGYLMEEEDAGRRVKEDTYYPQPRLTTTLRFAVRSAKNRETPCSMAFMRNQ